MLKRTIYVGNPAHLYLELNQLRLKRPGEETPAQATIADMGVLVLDHPQITLTLPLMQALMAENVALLVCDATHHPSGLMLTLADGHHLHSRRAKAQAAAKLPLKKQLWQQTVQAKLANQAAVLQKNHRKGAETLLRLAKEVRSGDPDNLEARGAARYWSALWPGFKRDRYGEWPNPLLNYGYAILRATVARALVASGLIPALGIFHQNQYNAFCLADDVMEPYRPLIDHLVASLAEQEPPEGTFGLTKTHKQVLLGQATLDVLLEDVTRPMQVAIQRTASSLANCYLGEEKHIQYPSFVAE